MAGVKLTSSSQGRAELSRAAGLLWLEMGATAALSPSHEELGIVGNGEVTTWGWVGGVLDRCKLNTIMG
jgi:hypothetical protein